jgi:hypothetical protein
MFKRELYKKFQYFEKKWAIEHLFFKKWRSLRGKQMKELKRKTSNPSADSVVVSCKRKKINESDQSPPSVLPLARSRSVAKKGGNVSRNL